MPCKLLNLGTRVHCECVLIITKLTYIRIIKIAVIKKGALPSKDTWIYWEPILIKL